MDKSLFNDLVESLKEARSISRNEIEASRHFKVESSNTKTDSKKNDASQTDFARSFNVDSNTSQNVEHQAENLSESTDAALIKLSTAGLKAFFNICRHWQLTNDQEIILLGTLNSASYNEWKRSPETARLDQHTLERISYLLGIYKSLQILLTNHISADAWIRKPNDAPLFSGKSALDCILSGNVSDLFLVRQYLDCEL